MGVTADGAIQLGRLLANGHDDLLLAGRAIDVATESRPGACVLERHRAVKPLPPGIDDERIVTIAVRKEAQPQPSRVNAQAPLCV